MNENMEEEVKEVENVNEDGNEDENIHERVDEDDKVDDEVNDNEKIAGETNAIEKIDQFDLADMGKYIRLNNVNISKEMRKLRSDCKNIINKNNLCTSILHEHEHHDLGNKFVVTHFAILIYFWA